MGGGGSGVRQICQEVVSEILEKQAETAFLRISSKVEEMLENCQKGHSKPKSNAYLQQFSWEPPLITTCFIQYPLLSQLGNAAGYIDPCLLPLLKH